MVLRINRSTEDEFVVLRLSGHVALREMAELGGLLAAESARPLVVDLRDVIQIDREAVGLLASLEAAGVELRHCPDYVAAWIASDKDVGSDGARASILPGPHEDPQLRTILPDDIE